MSRREPRLLPLLVATSTGAALLLGAPASAAGTPSPADLGTPAIEWTACGEDPDFDCGSVSVPLDYDEPAGAHIRIALARLPAAHPDTRIGSVFINPGGPGGSGVLMALQIGKTLADQLDGRFDVVGFDPRGINRSAGLQCFATNGDRDDYFADVPLFPYKNAQVRPFFFTLAGLSRECHDEPNIAAHMSTADVARDLDQLRHAVGDRQLTYLGFSYGSFLGSTYANLFPDRVRALVIDGVLNPRLWSSGWQVRSDRVATQEEFDEFLRLCDEAGDSCAFATPEGSAARWEDLARALFKAPYHSPDLDYSYDLLINDGIGAMYTPELWGGRRGYGAYFDYLADAILGGDVAAAGAAVDVRAELADRVSPNTTDAYDNGLDAYFGNQCADTQYPHDITGFRAVGAYARDGSRFGPAWYWFNNGCAHWPLSPDRYTGPWKADTSTPVLVVGNYFDGVTDYRGAQATARLLDARLLSYAGWGHTAYGRSACVMRNVDQYLINRTLPAAGTVCPANENPFLTTSNGSLDPLLGGLPSIRPLR